jgi:phosphoribosylformylglycinamidine cyclo-ligase
LKLINEIGVNGISHITGGGFYENIPRMLPEGLCAVINKEAFPVPPIFGLIQKTGKIPERDMFNTFNMGIGMCIAVDSDRADDAIKVLAEAGEKAYVIGHVALGEDGVEIC